METATTASSSSSSSSSSISISIGGGVPIPLTNNTLLCHPNQVKNPVYNLIRNVPKQVSNEIKSDYATSTACVLFLSLKFHNQHPKYIEMRIREIGRNYKIRILLVLVDTDDNVQLLLTMNKICFNTNFTLILAWSTEECARYLETVKIYESKSSSSIQEKVETEFLPKLTKVLTSVRSINKTDVATLLDTFGNLSNIINADVQQLMLCPGLGEKKVRRLHQAFHEPFIKKNNNNNNTTNLLPMNMRTNDTFSNTIPINNQTTAIIAPIINNNHNNNHNDNNNSNNNNNNEDNDGNDGQSVINKSNDAPPPIPIIWR